MLNNQEIAALMSAVPIGRYKYRWKCKVCSAVWIYKTNSHTTTQGERMKATLHAQSPRHQDYLAMRDLAGEG